MDDIHVIDLCTPSFLHKAQTLQVLTAGKDVICEKPVGGSLRDVDELKLAAAQAGQRMMPIYQYRFGHGAQKLKLLVDSGVTGRAYLTTVETHWRRRAEYYAAPWRGKWATELGGPLVTLAIHAHDTLTYILGPVKSVFARAKTQVNPIETEDCVSASLEMADGSLAALTVTTGSSQQISRHRFCFENLVAESNLDPYNNTFDPWTFIPDSPAIAPQIQATLATFDPQPQRFAGQFYRYYQAVKTGGPLPVTLDDAHQSLELITALYVSARTGQPVSLPISPDDPAYDGWQP